MGHGQDSFGSGPTLSLQLTDQRPETVPKLGPELLLAGVGVAAAVIRYCNGYDDDNDHCNYILTLAASALLVLAPAWSETLLLAMHVPATNSLRSSPFEASLVQEMTTLTLSWKNSAERPANSCSPVVMSSCIKTRTFHVSPTVLDHSVHNSIPRHLTRSKTRQLGIRQGVSLSVCLNVSMMSRRLSKQLTKISWHLRCCSSLEEPEQFREHPTQQQCNIRYHSTFLLAATCLGA